MANFHEAQQIAKKLTPTKISKDLFNFIRTLEKYLADLNVDQIFNFSEDVFGNALGFYSKGTELITKGEKKAGDPFTLKDTGEFLEDVFSKVDSDSIFFDTKDSKKPDVLRNLLSEDIFGLTDENLQKFINEKLTPFFQSYFKSKLS